MYHFNKYATGFLYDTLDKITNKTQDILDNNPETRDRLIRLKQEADNATRHIARRGRRVMNDIVRDDSNAPDYSYLKRVGLGAGLGGLLAGGLTYIEHPDDLRVVGVGAGLGALGGGALGYYYPSIQEAMEKSSHLRYALEKQASLYRRQNLLNKYAMSNIDDEQKRERERELDKKLLTGAAIGAATGGGLGGYAGYKLVDWVDPNASEWKKALGIISMGGIGSFLGGATGAAGVSKYYS